MGCVNSAGRKVIEAKDTVMSDEQIFGAINGENAEYVELTGIPEELVLEIKAKQRQFRSVAQAQAEPSFKAGEQESDKKWRLILKDSVAMAKLAGIREVVDFIKSVGYSSGDWRAKLKEWGVE